MAKKDSSFDKDNKMHLKFSGLATHQKKPHGFTGARPATKGHSIYGGKKGKK